MQQDSPLLKFQIVDLETSKKKPLIIGKADLRDQSEADPKNNGVAFTGGNEELQAHQ